MFVTVCMAVVVTAIGLVMFLLALSGNVHTFRKNFQNRLGSTLHRELINCTRRSDDIHKKELDVQLDVLYFRLDRKRRELQLMRTLQKLNTTSPDVVKYYRKLKEDINRGELDCEDIEGQINHFRRRRVNQAKSLASDTAAEISENQLSDIEEEMGQYSNSIKTEERCAEWVNNSTFENEDA